MSETFQTPPQGSTGAVVFTLQLAGTIEASPAIFDDMIVLTARGDTVYGIQIR